MSSFTNKAEVEVEAEQPGRDTLSRLLSQLGGSEKADSRRVEERINREDSLTGLDKATRRGRARSKIVNFRATPKVASKVDELVALTREKKADLFERLVFDELARVKREQRTV